MKKHKRIKIYTAITGIVILGVIGYFFCYKDYKVNKIMNEIIQCINRKQYDKAIVGIDSALSTKPDYEKAKGLKDSVSKYLTAKNLYSNNQFDEANSKANEISDYYDINGFKEDVDSLKKQINTSIERLKEQIEKQKALEKKQLAEKEENNKKEKILNSKNKTTTNNKQVKSKSEGKSDYKKVVSESKKKKVEKNNNEDSNDVRFKKILTNDEALALIKEKLGTKKKYKFEGIAASDLEGISAVFRTSKTLYVVNLYNGQIADANTGEIYVPAGR
ncbi:hypothetical protein ACFO6R_03810 [Eubacterium multiforme]|uniref:S18 family serine protease n=1 Tax=Eubacterium multiforme TaxID=83339 RepID=A0ABT9UPA0_9FIRM|nr:hypothetical protein [Eubacterium multiforme]MDQ0148112.1 putative S18 family serine protease [Eubacterium multiforme]